MNHALYKGGTPQVVFPGCFGQNVFGPPFPTRVAGEFDRGDFTLGDVLQPASRRYQADALSTAAVGDVADMVVVPEQHSMTELFVETDPNPSRMASVGCAADSMNGVTFDIVGTYYDNTTFAAIGPFVAPAGFTGLNANVAAAVHAFAQVYVPTGQSLVLGVKLNSAPTNTSVTFSDMAGRIALVAKVHDFDYPWVG